jgi:hypothetical protein
LGKRGDEGPILKRAAAADEVPLLTRKYPRLLTLKYHD